MTAGLIRVPQQAVELDKRFEGFHRVPKNDPGRAHPYLCPAEYWPIGYGRLCRPDHPPIDEPTASQYLMKDLRVATAATLRLCPVLATEPEQRLAVIVDFTFNLGAGRLQMSTLRRRVNQQHWKAAVAELKQWVYVSEAKTKGLLRRRCAEAEYLLNKSKSPARLIF